MLIFRPGRVDARIAALAAVVALHLALIAWLTMPRPLPVQPEPATVLALRDYRAPPVAEPLPPPVIAEPMAELVAPEIEIATDMAVSSSTDCAPTAALAAALADDVELRAALAALPPGIRTDAGAIMVWSGGWAAVAQAADAPLARTNAVVAQVLAALPPACLATPITGPELVFVRGAASTTILVFGSGTWDWGQVLRSRAIGDGAARRSSR